MRRTTLVFLALLAMSPWAFARSHAVAATGPADMTVLIIRHGEKPRHGRGLDAAGEARAQAYAQWFPHLVLAGGSAVPTMLYASADTRTSARERLTLAPLAHVLDEPVHQRFDEDQTRALAAHVRRHARPGGVVLICWHHERIAKLLRAFAADPASLLPDGRWPDDEFDWLIVLRYDADGRLVQQQRMRIPVDVPAE